MTSLQGHSVKSRSGTRSVAEILGVDFRGADSEITGVSLAAAEVEPGDLFVAIQGQKHHGLDFLAQALELGAVAVLSDRSVDTSVPVLVHPNPKQVVGLVCNEIFGSPSARLFAVTGTNGKTSTTSYLHQIFTEAGLNSALSTSVGFGFAGMLSATSLTTPELTTLRKQLRKFEQAGGEVAAIEVSAQALTRNRVDGLVFEIAGFTGLSRDHLDDYESMESYYQAKLELFKPDRAKQAVVFLADEYAGRLSAEAVIPVTTIGPGGDVSFKFDAQTLTLGGAVEFETRFPAGELMARNFAVAVVMAKLAGIDVSKLRGLASGFQVPGRLELVSTVKPHVYVDYAHTPDGISSAVTEILSRYQGVTLVFGASGNRDVGKRSEMGMAAAKATRVFLTDQHPRDEDPEQIRLAVASGLKAAGKEFQEFSNPEDAIAAAIASTPRDEAVLWCGPGHLKYREIAGQKVPFDARQIAKSLVEK
ncbi:MAG: UDP-N-acetylmuramoyl-L-alanyl-D-glutamate--2,6-diaminopimelate ligase [Actinobacteria bacterium]|nr:UDP-N-acetylmuramoyl-L-alanyl-D-glutamate--2,6-diaminopimelate ligase [Actinomycetota bacterium]